MPWITPSARNTGDWISYTDWVDQAIGNVRELYYRQADGFGGIMPSPSTSVAVGRVLFRDMRSIEVGGLEDWTALDTIQDEGNPGPAPGGGPGPVFTIPKGYSGIWAGRFVAGTTMATYGNMRLMWSLNSTQYSTGYPTPSTAEYNDWSYRWCVASGITYPSGDFGIPGGIIEKFTSGDKIRVYTICFATAGNHGSLNGTQSRAYFHFLGTTA